MLSLLNLSKCHIRVAYQHHMCENYFRLEVYLICLKYFSALVQFTNSEFLNFIITDYIRFLNVRVFHSMGLDKLFSFFSLE